MGKVIYTYDEVAKVGRGSFDALVALNEFYGAKTNRLEEPVSPSEALTMAREKLSEKGRFLVKVSVYEDGTRAYEVKTT